MQVASLEFIIHIGSVSAPGVILKCLPFLKYEMHFNKNLLVLQIGSCYCLPRGSLNGLIVKKLFHIAMCSRFYGNTVYIGPKHLCLQLITVVNEKMRGTAGVSLSCMEIVS